ncbi:helix-turn-helix transcriptional regulator [Nocardia sp. CDC160]|uniref:helix-turn-helix transcriptional regulator n=1 Tax=Nocardia sp. CDC160 TaxID=3112166 RepID=UPI002DBCFC92|nr:LuxR family transcriptional regulator [Nocardia sp. CDC160]MEC3916831.1 LuxR family transcriptional regulator [Nocardia sp. CDC160]
MSGALYGRDSEVESIDALIRNAEAGQRNGECGHRYGEGGHRCGEGGQSGSLALIGEAGEGKTALLDHAAARAGTGWQILRCAGVECESELPFAGLQWLLASGSGGDLPIDALPENQGAALRSAIGLAPPTAPVDRFQIGLATLSLLAELSASGPVLCLIDDAQWLDQATADALRFVARRLGNEGIVMLFAGRGEFAVTGIPTVQLAPLDTDASRRLLADRWPNLETEASERILLEAMGNPLALLELPRMDPDILRLGPLPLPARLRSGFEHHIAGLSAGVRTVLLVVAAEETGDLGLVLRALTELGLGEPDLARAEASGMVTVDPGLVRFRHPLQRAAAYHSAGFTERRAVHAALGASLSLEPDRRAWHLAAAASGPDETIAAALEIAAENARERAGYSAASTAMERAAGFTPEPARRGERLVRAVEWAAEAGRCDRAQRLAQAAEALPLTPGARARLGAARALIAFDDGELGKARELLLAAATQAAATEPDRAATMLVNAGRAAYTQGDLRAVRQARARMAELALPEPNRSTLLGTLDGPLALVTGDLETGIATVRATVAFSRSLDTRTPSVLLTLAGQALLVGDLAATRDVLLWALEEVRSRGMIGWFPAASVLLGNTELMLGHLHEARDALTEGLRIARDIDQPGGVAHAEGLLAVLAAIQGDEARCRELATRGLRSASADGNFIDLTHCEWALGLLDLGLGNHESALDRLEALYQTPDRVRGHWLHLLRDLVEAAARLRQPDRAAQAQAEIERWADALGSPFAEAIALRGHAALHGDGDAYEGALKLQAAEGLWYDHARTALLYGEWLRRERRRADARVQLRRAVETFERLGAELWAERARTELRATGEITDSTPTTDLRAALTPQELQVVRLAATGATNKEIAARLFLSPKTVGHHLYRAFPKLGVASRMELARLCLE